MNKVLQKDQALRPELFIWNGAVPAAKLTEWLQERRLELPDDLVEIWLETGGGDLFEGETILGPFGDRQLDGDVDSVNKHHRMRGMGADYLVVHVGSALTAIRLSNKSWVVLDEKTYSVLEEYASFAIWYEKVLREEFAERYGLPVFKVLGNGV